MTDDNAMTKKAMRKSTEHLFRVYCEHRTVMIAAADSAAGDARIRARLSAAGKVPSAAKPRLDQSRSKRSRFITLSHAATKSCTNLSRASSLA